MRDQSRHGRCAQNEVAFQLAVLWLIVFGAWSLQASIRSYRAVNREQAAGYCSSTAASSDISGTSTPRQVQCSEPRTTCDLSRFGHRVDLLGAHLAADLQPEHRSLLAVRECHAAILLNEACP